MLISFNHAECLHFSIYFAIRSKILFFPFFKCFFLLFYLWNKGQKLDIIKRQHDLIKSLKDDTDTHIPDSQLHWSNVEYCVCGTLFRRARASLQKHQHEVTAFVFLTTMQAYNGKSFILSIYFNDSSCSPVVAFPANMAKLSQKLRTNEYFQIRFLPAFSSSLLKLTMEWGSWKWIR